MGKRFALKKGIKTLHPVFPARPGDLVRVASQLRPLPTHHVNATKAIEPRIDGGGRVATLMAHLGPARPMPWHGGAPFKP